MSYALSGFGQPFRERATCTHHPTIHAGRFIGSELRRPPSPRRTSPKECIRIQVYYIDFPGLSHTPSHSRRPVRTEKHAVRWPAPWTPLPFLTGCVGAADFRPAPRHYAYYIHIHGCGHVKISVRSIRGGNRRPAGQNNAITPGPDRGRCTRTIVYPAVSSLGLAWRN